MQVDPRADHGFHSPDPLLTRQLGIPNACNRCHSDESVDWAVEWSERWYGPKLAQSRQRQRALAIAAAQQFEADGMQALLQLAKDEDIPYWSATYLSLSNCLPNRIVEEHIQSKLCRQSNCTQSRYRALSQTHGMDLLHKALGDKSRTVRISAARALEVQGNLPTDSPAAQDLEDYLSFNSDRPQSLLLLASRASRERDLATLNHTLERMIAYDRANAEVYRQAAILLVGPGKMTRPKRDYRGWSLDPTIRSSPTRLDCWPPSRTSWTEPPAIWKKQSAWHPILPCMVQFILLYQAKPPRGAARAMHRARQGP